VHWATVVPCCYLLDLSDGLANPLAYLRTRGKVHIFADVKKAAAVVADVTQAVEFQIPKGAANIAQGAEVVAQIPRRAANIPQRTDSVLTQIAQAGDGTARLQDVNERIWVETLDDVPAAPSHLPGHAAHFSTAPGKRVRFLNAGESFGF